MLISIGQQPKNLYTITYDKLLIYNLPHVHRGSKLLHFIKQAHKLLHFNFVFHLDRVVYQQIPKSNEMIQKTLERMKRAKKKLLVIKEYKYQSFDVITLFYSNSTKSWLTFIIMKSGETLLSHDTSVADSKFSNQFKKSSFTDKLISSLICPSDA